MNVVIERPEEGPRQNRLTALDIAKTEYSIPSDVVVGGRFRERAVNTHRYLEARVKEIRDRIAPQTREIQDLQAELDKLEKLFIAAWQEGARSADGSVTVEEKPAAQRWSKTLVTAVVEALGSTYNKAVELAEFGTVFKLRIYR